MSATGSKRPLLATKLGPETGAAELLARDLLALPAALTEGGCRW